MDILNIPLEMVKPAILNQELKAMNKSFNEETMSLGDYCRRVNSVVNQVYAMSSFSELIYFKMEGTDFTEEESQSYISNLYFEQSFQFN